MSSRWFVVALGVLAAAPATSAAPTTWVAASGRAERPARARTVDVTHVALDLHFDWTARRAIGKVTLSFTPLAPTRRVTFDASRLAIQSVTTSAGQPLAFTYDGGDRPDGFAVTLDRLYRPGEAVTVVVAYHTTWVNESDPNNLAGSNGQGLRFFQPTFTEPKKRRQIWSMGEPEGNRYWFPSYDSPDDPRTSELALTVEAPLVAVANGRLVETRINAGGTRTFVWRADVPYANHLTSFVVGDYAEVTQSAGEVSLHSYGYPDEVEAVRASVERLPDMVRYFSDVIGAPLPSGRYSQVFVQDLPWGTGSLGVSTLTENMVDDARTHRDYLYLWDGLEAEALANQWFGVLLTARDWRHAWLNRAFAHYFDALYDERANGRDNTLLWKLAGDHATYHADWSSGVRHPVVPASTTRASEWAADNVPYARGALVLHLLRTSVGDEAWWRIVKRYVTSHAGRTVTTRDFQRAVEGETGASWEWFFAQWVYGTGHPVFQVSTTYDVPSGVLTMRATQTHAPDAPSPFPKTRYFEGPIDIAVDGRIERVRLKPVAVNVFRFGARSRPRIVTFDHGGAWIKELHFTKSIDDLTYQMLHDADAVGRRWAMDQLVAIASRKGTAVAEKARVVNGLRTLVDSDAHWRLKYSALLHLTTLLAPLSTGAAVVLDAETIATLVRAVDRESSWVKSVAIALLGRSGDARYLPRYEAALDDWSHPVNHAAAEAIGRTKDPTAFDGWPTTWVGRVGKARTCCAA